MNLSQPDKGSGGGPKGARGFQVGKPPPVGSKGLVAPAFARAIAATGTGKPALVNVLVDPATGSERSDPLLQMISFNPMRFGGA